MIWSPLDRPSSGASGKLVQSLVAGCVPVLHLRRQQNTPRRAIKAAASGPIGFSRFTCRFLEDWTLHKLTLQSHQGQACEEGRGNGSLKVNETLYALAEGGFIQSIVDFTSSRGF